MYLPFLRDSEHLSLELLQCEQEGRDISAVSTLIEAVARAKDRRKKERLAAAIFDELQRQPARLADEEPDGRLADIAANRPAPATREQLSYDALLGAWYGAAAGDLLGKPFTHWGHEAIAALLRSLGNYPPRYPVTPRMIPSSIRERYAPGQEAAGADRGGAMLPNFAIDGMILGLHLYEQHAEGLCAEHLAEAALALLPIMGVPPSYRIAMRNALLGVEPGEAARIRNPYREWAAGQAFSNIYGIIAVGDPVCAARLTYEASSFAHVNNGNYGPMFCAALVALAQSGDSLADMISSALLQIPPKSRLAGALADALQAHARGDDLYAALEALHRRWDDAQPYGRNHAIPNAVVVAYALLYGGLDFERSLGIALLMGHNPALNCATIGCIVGSIHGYARLPEVWVEPVRQGVASRISGMGVVRLEDLAQRTRMLLNPNNDY